MKKAIALFPVFSLFLLVTMIPLGGNAEERAGSLSISPVGGAYIFDNEQDIKKDAIGGAGVSYNFDKNWGSEIMVNYGRFGHEYFDSPDCCCKEEKVDGYIMHLDALYHFRPEQKLVPYLAAGIGGVVLDGEHLDNEYVTVNYGGGLKYSLSDNIALRGDARHIYDPEDSNHNGSVTLGLTFQFGGEKKKMPERTERTAETREQPQLAAEETVGIDEFRLAPVKDKISIDLKLQFDLDKAVLRPEYHDNIRKLAEFMKSYPQTHADIEGHTCNIGSARYNFELSWRRAESVKNYLIKHFGIEAGRIRTFGYGLTRPLADNSREEGRMKNRRVIVIVSNGAEKDAAAKPEKGDTSSRILRDIQMRMEKGKLNVALMADRRVNIFNAFQLRNPDRLVVDLPGKWSYKGESRRVMNSESVENIRIGKHPDKLRVVFDLKAGKPASAAVNPVSYGLLVNLDASGGSRLSLK